MGYDPAVFHSGAVFFIGIILAQTVVIVSFRLSVEAVEHFIQIAVSIFYHCRLDVGIVLVGQGQTIHDMVVHHTGALLVPVGILPQIQNFFLPTKQLEQIQIRYILALQIRSKQFCAVVSIYHIIAVVGHIFPVQRILVRGDGQQKINILLLQIGLDHSKIIGQIGKLLLTEQAASKIVIQSGGIVQPAIGAVNDTGHIGLLKEGCLHLCICINKGIAQSHVLVEIVFEISEEIPVQLALVCDKYRGCSHGFVFCCLCSGEEQHAHRGDQT